MPKTSDLAIVVAVVASGVSGVVDLSTRRVPNGLTFGITTIGVAMAVLQVSHLTVASSLAGFVIVYLANLIFVLVNTAQLGIPQDDGGAVGFARRTLVVQFVLLQFAIPAAVAGWLGASARRRLMVQRWR